MKLILYNQFKMESKTTLSQMSIEEGFEYLEDNHQEFSQYSKAAELKEFLKKATDKLPDEDAQELRDVLEATKKHYWDSMNKLNEEAIEIDQKRKKYDDVERALREQEALKEQEALHKIWKQARGPLGYVYKTNIEEFESYL